MDSGWQIILFSFVTSFTISLLLIWPLIWLLRRKNILDVPNSRSSHSTATPKGAGIIIISVIIFGWLFQLHVFDINIPSNNTVIIVCIAAFLSIISWIDDLKGLSPLIRLIMHFICTSAAYYFAPFEGPVFQGLVNIPADFFLTVLLWVWFINLFNFMDGIDGITGGQTITICLGLIFISYSISELNQLMPYITVVLGAMFGFLVWNWSPAKIFLGDVGSAPLGFLIGWLLLSVATAGLWQISLILPGYYLADASITLISRLIRKERIWEAHREHFYQRALMSGLGHRGVSVYVVSVGLILVLSATLNTKGFQALSWVIAIVAITIILAQFSKTSTKP